MDRRSAHEFRNFLKGFLDTLLMESPTADLREMLDDFIPKEMEKIKSGKLNDFAEKQGIPQEEFAEKHIQNLTDMKKKIVIELNRRKNLEKKETEVATEFVTLLREGLKKMDLKELNEVLNEYIPKDFVRAGGDVEKLKIINIWKKEVVDEIEKRSK